MRDDALVSSDAYRIMNASSLPPATPAMPHCREADRRRPMEG